MINLLPPERAQGIRYGRLNAILARWVAGIAVAIVVLIAIISTGWLYINQQSKNLQSDINSSQTQLNTQDVPKVQAEADEISGDVKVVNQVLNNEVRFSDLFRAIGKIMPQGTILGSLSLTKVSGAIQLTASATDSSAATQVAINLGDPANGLFSKVDIDSIVCPGSTSGVSSTYNCTITLTALFSKDAQGKFLGVAKASQ